MRQTALNAAGKPSKPAINGPERVQDRKGQGRKVRRISLGEEGTQTGVFRNPTVSPSQYRSSKEGTCE